jgi:ABC-type phosphate transport system substrate-binding protein
MIDAMKSTVGAVGYESQKEAQKAGLVIAELRNAESRTVPANPATVAAALANARWDVATGAADLDGSTGAASYPMTVVTYALLPVAGKPGRKAALAFVQAAVVQGDADVIAAGFVPMPVAAKNMAR